MKSHWSRVTVCAVAILFQLAATVSAQQVQRGSIAGSITDDTGAALPGVNVTVTSPALQVPQIVRVSNERGEYQVLDLPAGTYRVAYELSGFATLVREGIELTTGFAARVDASMKLASVAETITVAGETPLVDVTSTRGGTTVSNDMIALVPGNQNFRDVMLMVGGVTSVRPPMTGQISTEAGGFTGKTYGQNSGTALIEGVKMNPNESPDFTTFEEVDVKTFGNTADVDTPGASVQLVLKSGGNQFHGKYTEIAQHERFSSDNIDDKLRAQNITIADSLIYYNDLAADLGGRIIRDRLWFYGAARDFRNESKVTGFSRNPGADGVYGTVDDTPATTAPGHTSATLKISYQATPKNRFIGYIQYNGDYYQLGQGRFVPEESTIWLRQHSMEEKPIEWQGALSNKWYVNMMWGHGGYDARRTYVGGWEPNCRFACPNRFDRNTGQITGPDFSGASTRRNIPKRNQITGSVNYIPNDFWGAHAMQAGYRVWKGVQFYRNPGGPESTGIGEFRLVYDTVGGVPHRPVEFVARNYPVEGENVQNVYALYLMDSWRPSRRVTFNLGVRWDKQVHYVPAQTKVQGTFGTSGEFPKVEAGTYSAFAPRVGMAFDVTGDGRTVVKGTYGWFNDDLGVNGYAQQFNVNSIVDVTYRWRDLNNDGEYQAGEVNFDLNGSDFLSVSGATNNFVNPDLRLPHTHEASASIERELGRGLSVRGLYVHKRVIDSFQNVNTLRPASVYDQAFTRRDPGPDGVLNNADDGDMITIYDYNPAYRGAAFVRNMNVNGREDVFNNFELMFTRRLAGNWFANTSLLATKYHRWLVSVRQSPNDDVNALDSTWEMSVRLAAGYNLPRGFVVSTLYQGYNGLPRQRTYVFRAADPAGGRAFPSSGTITMRMEPYGATRGPARHIANLRFAKDFALGGGRKITTGLDAFNAFNSNIPWAVGGGSGLTDASGPTYGFVTKILEPRVFRFSVGFEF
jgi:hypothetical protein